MRASRDQGLSATWAAQSRGKPPRSAWEVSRGWTSTAVVLAITCALLGSWCLRLHARRGARGTAEVASDGDDAMGARPWGALQPCDEASARRGERAASVFAGDADHGDMGPETARGAGFWAQGLVTLLAPHAGEDLIDYRDRVVPILQSSVAPERRRAVRQRSAFDEAAQLDPGQRRALDEIGAIAGAELQSRVLEVALSDDPRRFRPTRVVSLVRDFLEPIEAADRSLRAVLRPEQIEVLDSGDFDLVSWVAATTPWEELVGMPSASAP